MNRFLSLASISLSVALSMPVKAAQTDWFIVDTILTRTGVVSDDVHRYGLPRGDLKVSLDGVALKPGFALGGLVAFEPMGDKAMMMGDLVLTETEINPVMSKLLSEGLQVTALHNHLLRANPPTFYMHVAGTGDPAQLAATRARRTGGEQNSIRRQTSSGSRGGERGRRFRQGEGRCGDRLQREGERRRLSVRHTPRGQHQDGWDGSPRRNGDGDCDQLPADVEVGRLRSPEISSPYRAKFNPLITALRDNGIEVTAIHNHMVGDDPRTFFIHFWANDDAIKLANGLGAALKTLNVAQK